MDDAFARACRWAAAVTHASPTKAEAAADRRLREALARLSREREALDSLEDGLPRVRQERRIERASSSVEAAKSAKSGERLRADLAFAGIAAEPHEVRALANLVLLAALVASMTVAAIVLGSGLPAFPALPVLLFLPFFAFLAVLGHPASAAKRARLACLGDTPEAVSYLAMSLRARPSLDRAIAFAAEHMEGPFGARMRRVLWEVHLRTRGRIEDGLTALADEWGAWNQELHRALYAIVQAVRDGSKEGMPRALDRARSVAYEGARRRLQDYATGLRGPTTALFALGVLLPLILGSMLPLLSLGSFVPTSLEVVQPTPPNPWPWILLLDVAFPALTFALAHHVSSRRPGTRAAPDLSRPPIRLTLLVLPAAALAVVCWFLPIPLAPLLAIGVFASAASVVVFRTTRDARAKSKRMAALEAELPDALFQLGSRLGEGRGLEDALLAVAGGRPGTASADVFDRVARALRLGGTAQEALFGSQGALRDVPSRTVRATVKMVLDLAAKDPEEAGRATLEMSAHLRDLQQVHRDLRAELRPTVDAMRTTATFFAPVVLGVTGSLYGLLADAFSAVATLPMAVPTFHAVLGIYLVLSSTAILHFATRLEDGGGIPSLGAAMARALPLGYGVFAATLLLAGFAL